MRLRLFSVAPGIPKPLRFLETLARNLWWCWNPDAIEIFRRIHPQLWRETGSNPIELLNRVPQQRLSALASDEGFLTHLREVQERFVAESRGKVAESPGTFRPCIAYFSLEYGLHETLRIYSGGLGILAGDHLKSSSDLHLPLVAVGIFYYQGYFTQYLNREGWQQESYPDSELHKLPLRRASDASGQALTVSVRLPECEMKAAVWQLDVGRVPVFLLDTNIPENSPDIQRVTAQLYAGDRLMRLRQELLLGFGGFQAVIEMGFDPQVCHMNEGHAAFATLARLSYLMKRARVDFATAVEIVARSTVFTTHTPVPAGNEAFSLDMLRPHLQALKDDLRLDPEQIISLGKSTGWNPNELSMTVLGIRLAHYRNGVSRLHGVVERKMWAHLWPGFPENEVPIFYITNGVHVPSWISLENGYLLDRYLGSEWRNGVMDDSFLQAINNIPDEELWRAHELGRARLVRVSRELCERQMAQRNAPRAEINQAKSVLDYDVLTIGFARRFATYKRATLLLRDTDRLVNILKNEDRPVQIIFAGKAHPSDDAGKDFIRQVVHFSQRTDIKRRVVFLENYDIRMARYLVQGVDVWLNTPRRPLEASGTSGMKAAINGGLHLSVVDGWWDEAYSKDCGWAIGRGEEYDDPDYQDAIESQALYNLLENDVIPTFYDRPSSDVPARWVAMMKASMKMALGHFSSHRMVSEYDKFAYKPAQDNYNRLTVNQFAEAKNLVAQRQRLESLWGKIRMEMPTVDRDISMLHVGDSFRVTTAVHLGDLRPDEVEVSAYYGPVSAKNVIMESTSVPMIPTETRSDGAVIYSQDITCHTTGQHGLTTRLVPKGDAWKLCVPGFIIWADGAMP